MIVSRRHFLAMAASAAAARIVVPAFTPPREPYVRASQSVSYIGLARYPAPVFSGAAIIDSVCEWDGLGYPCRLWNQSFGCAHRLMDASFYDFDLSDFLVDLPEQFWVIPGHEGRYPNVHAYVREKRFGESPDVMRRLMRQVAA